MIFINSIILGIVQALTEFLPVSSSGHLVILHDILSFNLDQNIAFDVALHMGTALALVIYFWQDLWNFIKNIVFYIIPNKKADKQSVNTVFLLIVASIPAIVLGLLFEDIIEKVLHQTWIVVVTLIIGAILLLIIEKVGKQNKEIKDLTPISALYIGFGQALALIPGLSRSGITIISGMSKNLSREQAARFSFLMGIPIILGSGTYKLLKIDWVLISSDIAWAFIIGFIVSAFIGSAKPPFMK